MNPPFSNPYSNVVCVDGALQSGKSKTKERRAVCTPFSRLKTFEAQVIGRPGAKGFLAHCNERSTLFEIWCSHNLGIRFLRRSYSLCGIFLFLKCIANTASITRIYDNLQNFKTSGLAVFLLIEADPDQLMSEITDL